jgi:hypothetical protein
MTEIMVAEAVEIEQLNKSRAERVNELQGMIYSSAQNMVEYAIEIGQILIEVKASLSHGEWMPWCMANLDVKKSMIENYMKMARYSQRVGNLEGVSSIREALKLLEPPKEPKLLPTRVDSTGQRYEPAHVRFTEDGEEEYVDGEYEESEVDDRKVVAVGELNYYEGGEPSVDMLQQAYRDIENCFVALTNMTKNRKESAFYINAIQDGLNTLVGKVNNWIERNPDYLNGVYKPYSMELDHPKREEKRAEKRDDLERMM